MREKIKIDVIHSLMIAGIRGRGKNIDDTNIGRKIIFNSSEGISINLGVTWLLKDLHQTQFSKVVTPFHVASIDLADM